MVDLTLGGTWEEMDPILERMFLDGVEKKEAYVRSYAKNLLSVHATPKGTEHFQLYEALGGFRRLKVIAAKAAGFGLPLQIANEVAIELSTLAQQEVSMLSEDPLTRRNVFHLALGDGVGDGAEHLQATQAVLSALFDAEAMDVVSSSSRYLLFPPGSKELIQDVDPDLSELFWQAFWSRDKAAGQLPIQGYFKANAKVRSSWLDLRRSAEDPNWYDMALLHGGPDRKDVEGYTLLETCMAMSDPSWAIRAMTAKRFDPAPHNPARVARLSLERGGPISMNLAGRFRWLKQKGIPFDQKHEGRLAGEVLLENLKDQIGFLDLDRSEKAKQRLIANWGSIVDDALNGLAWMVDDAPEALGVVAEKITTDEVVQMAEAWHAFCSPLGYDAGVLAATHIRTTLLQSEASQYDHFGAEMPAQSSLTL